MKFPLRTGSAIISASLALAGFTCAGQTIPPPASAGPPVVQPETESAARPSAPKPAVSEPAEAPAAPAGKTTPAPKGGAASENKAGSNKPSGKAYVIGPLDELEIKIWNDSRLSGFTPVSAEGLISIPLIGPIKADGLTEEQLKEAIRQKLAESVFARAPEPNEITVTVVRNNSKKIYVYGGVFKPGEYPLNGDMTVMDVLALCLPFKDFAKQKDIVIMRGDQRIKFNYPEFIKGKKMDQNIQLQNGDRIIIPE